MLLRLVALSLATAVSLAGCATRPTDGASAKTAFVAPQNPKKHLDADDPVAMEPAAWGRPLNPGRLGGRTLTVSSLSELKLRNKEVILTFDDGPMPGKTETILKTLNQYGVNATFLMVGQMAETYPAIARKVVASGNSIGSHTYRHRNLRGIGFDAAMAEVERGEKAVERATASDVGFFRFPYLADTRKLRNALSARGLVITDVDVDSKDYFKDAPSAVAARTMASLRKHGHGIILMHDIHKRTGTMLPALLDELKAGGYKVVTLRHKRTRMPSLLLASAE